MNEFIVWMNEKGFQLHPNIEFGLIDGVRSTIAREGREIKAGETLFQVPISTLLSSSNKNSIVSHLKLCRTIKDNWVSLILSLMAEDSALEHSFWNSYMNILPTINETSKTNPLFWSEEELKWLTGTETLFRLGKNEILRQWETNAKPIIEKHRDIFQQTTRNTLVDSENFSLFETFEHFGIISMSRAFESHPKFIGRPMITPMADCLNSRTGLCNSHLEIHQNSNSTTTNIEFLPMITISDVGSKEELINTYGDLPNGELLRRYGYTDPSNPFDCCCVPIDFLLSFFENENQQQQNLLRNRMKFLIEKEIIPEDSFTLANDNLLPVELRRAVKVLTMNSNVYKLHKMKHGGFERFNAKKSSLTLSDWRIIESAINKRLSQYPTTLENDLEMFQTLTERKTTNTNNQFNALRVSIGEKQILSSLLSECSLHKST